VQSHKVCSPEGNICKLEVLHLLLVGQPRQLPCCQRITQQPCSSAAQDRLLLLVWLLLLLAVAACRSSSPFCLDSCKDTGDAAALHAADAAGALAELLLPLLL
jgi:hypothetical protein